MRIAVFLLLLCPFVGCRQSMKSNRPEEANRVSDHFYIKGQLGYDSYAFCSVVPEDVPYAYKVGKWKYWNLDGQLVAEGVFRLDTQVVRDHGGCPYSFRVGKIDRDSWRFWDKNGLPFHPANTFIEELESCKTILIK